MSDRQGARLPAQGLAGRDDRVMRGKVTENHPFGGLATGARPVVEGETGGLWSKKLHGLAAWTLNCTARLPVHCKAARLTIMPAKRAITVLLAAVAAAVVAPDLVAQTEPLEVKVLEPARSWFDRAPEWIAATGVVFAALIGFLGGTVFNHHLEVRRQNRSREDEAVALACVLFAELLQMEKDVEFVLVICRYRQDDGQNIGDDELGLFVFYQMNYSENIARLGLLGSRCANRVIEVYGRSESIKRKVQAAGGGDPEWAIPELGTLFEAIEEALIELSDFANTRRPSAIEANYGPANDPNL